MHLAYTWVTLSMQKTCQVYMNSTQVNMRAAHVQRDGGSARVLLFIVVGTQVHQK